MSLACWRRMIFLHMCLHAHVCYSHVWPTHHTTSALWAQMLTRELHSMGCVLWFPKKKKTYQSWVGFLLFVYVAVCSHSCMHICVYKHKQTSNCAGWLDFPRMVSGSYELMQLYSMWGGGRTNNQADLTYKDINAGRQAGRQTDVGSLQERESSKLADC